MRGMEEVKAYFKEYIKNYDTSEYIKSLAGYERPTDSPIMKLDQHRTAFLDRCLSGVVILLQRQFETSSSFSLRSATKPTDHLHLATVSEFWRSYSLSSCKSFLERYNLKTSETSVTSKQKSNKPRTNN